MEILLLRREEGLKKRWEVEFEENLNWATTRSPLHVGVDERENLGSVENSHLDQSLLSELGSTWNGGVQLEQSLNSSQEVASQTDLFASELEGLKQSMADDLPERKHCCTVEEDDCSLDMHLEDEGQEGVTGFDGGNIEVQDEAVEESETTIEEELRRIVISDEGLSASERDDDQLEELKKTFSMARKLGSPLCGKSNILGMEMLADETETNSLFGREASIRKPSSVDCAVNTETFTNEKKLSKATFAGL